MGTKTLRKATAAETIIGSPPFPPSPSVPWVSHIPSTSAVDQHPGVTRQREVALIFVSAHAPREGCSSPSCSALPTRAHPRRLQGAGSAAAAAPLPTSHGPFPSELRCPRCSSTAAARPLCLGGTFSLFPSSASRETGLSPETKTAASTGGGGWRRLPRRSPTVAHTPSHPRKCPDAPRSSLNPRGDGHTLSPWRRASPSELPGRARASSAPARCPLRPSIPSTLPACGWPGGRESLAPTRAANSPASAGAASRGEARRGGKAAPPTPAATGCRSGSQQLADPRRLRGTGRRRRRRRRLPALAEGPEPPGGAAGPSRVAKTPGQHGSRAAEPRGRPTNPPRRSRGGREAPTPG